MIKINIKMSRINIKNRCTIDLSNTPKPIFLLVLEQNLLQKLKAFNYPTKRIRNNRKRIYIFFCVPCSTYTCSLDLPCISFTLIRHVKVHQLNQGTMQDLITNIRNILISSQSHSKAIG